MLTGVVHSFIGLFIFRFLLGLFESVFNPCIYSIICDFFAPAYRSRANAVFNVGIYFGGALASISLNFIENQGWRFTYIIVGFIGIIFGIFSLVIVREPKRNRFDLMNESFDRDTFF